MSSVKDKIKLCSIDLNGVFVENINGVPFYERYIEFGNTLRKYVNDKRCHEAFAQPVFNPTNNTLDWYVPSGFSNPIKLSDLKGTQDGDEYSSIKENAIKQIERIMPDIPEHDQKYLKCLIKYASSDYADEMVFCNDGNIIFGVWGLKMINGKSISTSIRTDIDDNRIYSINYSIRGNGVLVGVKGVIKRRHGHILNGNKDIPNVVPEEGYEFSSWEPNAPQNKKVESNLNFVAVCTKLPEEAPVEQIIETSAEESISTTEEPTFSNVRFNGGNQGKIKGIDSIKAKNGVPIPTGLIPRIKPRRGYEFSGWDSDITEPISADKVFTAQYKKQEKPSERGLFGGGGLFGWGRSIFGGFGGGWLSGCLSWIMGAILLALLIFLLSLLFRGCGTSSVRIPTRTAPIPEVIQEPKIKEVAPVQDYEPIRALIREYEQRIEELEKMLPENQPNSHSQEINSNSKASDNAKFQI